MQTNWREEMMRLSEQETYLRKQKEIPPHRSLDRQRPERCAYCAETPAGGGCIDKKEASVCTNIRWDA